MCKLLVLDFDGTITDAEIEGVPFRDGYLEDVAILCGQTQDKVKEMAAQFEAEIAAEPDNYGWIINGKIVAPASVDPYLRVMPIARKIFDTIGVFKNEEERTRLLDSILYKYNYPKTVIAFRDGAGQVLSELSGTNTWIVTNSHTDPVQHKIKQLDIENGGVSWLIDRVLGSAKKYIVDDSFDLVPESIMLPGLDRKVYLRHKKYFNILDKLRKQCNAKWEEVTVIGDIFELDLALPWYLGARVGLMVNPFTPAYEKEFLKKETRGYLLHSLNELKEIADL